MLAQTIFTSCLMLIVSVQSAAVAPRAVPDATTGRLAARAVTSGGNTCYFRCPERFPSSENQEAVLQSNTGAGGVCEYDGVSRGFTCVYNADGSLTTNEPVSDPNCPAVAEDAGCTPTGAGPADPNYFRRSTRRSLTRAQEIIRARQYKPKKAIRRQAQA